MSSWARGSGTITLFVDDLAEASQFYEDVFGLSVTFEDDDSTIFHVDGTVVTLLRTRPTVAGPASRRVPVAVEVDDIDATREQLAARGVMLEPAANDPSWGARTATFRGPDGHVWEIAA